MTDLPENESTRGSSESRPSVGTNLSPNREPQHCSQSGEDLLQYLGDSISDKIASPNTLISIPEFKPGTIIGGKYQIVKFIDRGNAAMVYQSRHIMLDKVFAIKVLAPGESAGETITERFQREAHAAASLSHPNIISVYDFGALPEGTLYLVMEYLEGDTLAERLEKQGPLSLEQCLPIFIQVCLALEYAHNQGVIHRDLKPSNIMMLKDYKGDALVKVIDFSIAKFTRPKPNQRTITKPGQIFGTPLYMSPEQCQGKRPDHRSDIYSFGCVLYETVCGVPPLTGDSMLSTIYKHVNDLPLPFSQQIKNANIPKELEAIVFKALAKQPENRFQSAADMCKDLEALQEKYYPSSNKSQNASSFSNGTKQPGPFSKTILLLLLACFVIAICLFSNIKGLH